LQTHCPLLLHCWVDAHAAHGAPPLPHVVGPLVLHSSLTSQQPVHDDVESHTQAVPSQRWPGLQVVHGPPLPHAELLGVVMQVLPLQQPLGHEVALHTHCPALQARPASHV
jgi:hypothetical protein